MEAYDVAFFDCGVLHHDISVGSIVLTDDRGLLVDWDLRTKLDHVTTKKSPVARRPTRMGTWQFMSVMLLDPKKTTIRHNHHDDLESAFYVLLWTSLRYTKTEAAPKTRYTPQDTLGAFDELWVGSYGRKVGGSRKRLLLMPYKDEGIVFTERPELNSLMAELAAVLSVRYGNVPTAAEIANLENALVEMEALPATLIEATRKTVLASSVYNYQQTMKKLDKRGWLTETIRKYVDMGQWPTDASCVQVTVKINVNVI
ncbi:hypothetical protein BJ912DRAFT_901578 [Pholiota molesta]|nr:hypothetical protein BJ912DRAFT_901578 [Pholiota molesta]